MLNTRIFAGYVFWSVFTSLVPSLFYFSVWELGIAGAELSLVAILSPIFLGIGPFKDWAATRGGRTALHCFSLLGPVAYIAPKAVHRLILVFFANVFLCIGAAVDWTGSCATDVFYQSTRTSTLHSVPYRRVTPVSRSLQYRATHVFHIKACMSRQQSQYVP